jgi:pimeloyl-ACP methyl ester carboxylesterase
LYDGDPRRYSTGLPADFSRGGPAIITRELLADFAVPTLMITSEHDVLFPPEAIREVAGIIPGAELTELRIAGHSPYFETPEVFNDLVAAYLARHC